MQGWKKGVVFVVVGGLGCFFCLEISSMRRHLHDFFTASADEMTAMMVPNGGTYTEQTKAMRALTTGVADRRLVGSDGMTADGP